MKQACDRLGRFRLRSSLRSAVGHAWASRSFTQSAAALSHEVDVVIALGSNMGNRALNMHRALRKLREMGIQVLRHSSLYETSAAYVTNQPSFLNAAVLARTSLRERELLKVLKQLEADAGRDHSPSAPRFGPRPLDLDILFHGVGTFVDDRLEVPHPRWRERPFVLAPVSDLLYARRDDPHRDALAAMQYSNSGHGTAGGGGGSASVHPRDGADRQPFHHGPGCVLGYLRTAARLWETTGARAAEAAEAAENGSSGGGGGCAAGGGGHGSGSGSFGGGSGGSRKGFMSGSVGWGGVGVLSRGGLSTLSGGEVMRRVTPLLNMPPQEGGHGYGGGGLAGQEGSGSGSGSGVGDTAVPYSETHRIQITGRPLSGREEAAAAAAAAAAASTSEVLLSWGSKTYIMAILNITPDSFSDGGLHYVGGTGPGTGHGGEEVAGSRRLDEVVAAAERLVSEGADILDVGGQSTRPGAVRLGPEEELGRVLPVIRALRASPKLRGVPISVDTFHSEVARQAVAAGANMVNDVSGGSLDPRMADTVAELGVPYVVMHMRGDPGTMARAEHTAYGSSGGVWRGVGAELQTAAERAEAAGVPAWSIILDPGIGFAKDTAGNVQLLRHLRRLRREALEGPYAAGGPLLLGPSRKRFLGDLTGRQQPVERDAATAAACVVGVAGGADVVRVHSVRDVRDAMRVADAVYRGG